MSDPGAQNGPPAGWYPDPQAPPGRTGRRYWDGTAWTEHVVADPPGVRAPTTPDGVPLASWGRRLGAYAIDGAVCAVIRLVLGFPFVLGLVRLYVDYVRQVLDAPRTGVSPTPSLDTIVRLYLLLLGFGAVGLVVVLAYQAAFLRASSATPGKLALGLRVRLRECPGRLTWSTIARRLMSSFVVTSGLGVVPVVGMAGAVYGWVDGLWPLRDHRREALHDKLAHTVVVRL